MRAGGAYAHSSLMLTTVTEQSGQAAPGDKTPRCMTIGPAAPLTRALCDASAGPERLSSPEQGQRGSLMHRNVIGLVALDLVLRLLFAGMPRIAFIRHLASVNLHDPAAHTAASEFQAT